LVFFKYRTQSSGKGIVNIIQVHSDLYRNTFSSRFISWTFFPCRRFHKIINEM
jgi:hypothetical protein